MCGHSAAPRCARTADQVSHQLRLGDRLEKADGGGAGGACLGCRGGVQLGEGSVTGAGSRLAGPAGGQQDGGGGPRAAPGARPPVCTTKLGVWKGRSTGTSALMKGALFSTSTDASPPDPASAHCGTSSMASTSIGGAGGRRTAQEGSRSGRLRRRDIRGGGQCLVGTELGPTGRGRGASPRQCGHAQVAGSLRRPQSCCPARPSLLQQGGARAATCRAVVRSAASPSQAAQGQRTFASVSCFVGDARRDADAQGEAVGRGRLAPTCRPCPGGRSCRTCPAEPLRACTIALHCNP